MFLFYLYVKKAERIIAQWWNDISAQFLQTGVLGNEAQDLPVLGILG